MIILSKEQILKIHASLIQATGGSEGIRDEGMLDLAALAKKKFYSGLLNIRNKFYTYKNEIHLSHKLYLCNGEFRAYRRHRRDNMLDTIPNKEEMTDLIGKSLFDVWNKLCALIEEKYDMDRLWDHGGKAWKYEYKYRRGGKTLCALYARENCVGFMIILGKDERLKFEMDRENYSKEVQAMYDEAHTYHDGKWIMFEPVDASLFDDFIKLLRIKRKPNRK